jgi:nicotinamidase-related amidase
MTSTTAVLVLDMQLGFFTLVQPPIYQGDELLIRVSALLASARRARVPIVYMQHNTHGPLDGSEAWHIHPQIQPLPHEIVIQKDTPDPFLNTPLHAELRRQGITHIVVMGFQTEYCVDTTCRRAWSLGYRVTLVQDAHSTFDSPTLTAQQIIAHHTHILGAFATITPAHAIAWNDGSNSE